MDADIIRIQDYLHSTPSPESARPTVRIGNGDDISATTKRDAGEKYVSASRLYPFGDTQGQDLQQPLRLIREAESYTERAMQALDENDRVSCELAMQHLKALMPELFCHRNIGDGFASLISAIFYATKNNAGSGFGKDQITEIDFVVRRLSEEPFIGFEEAQRLIDGLERVGFAVEPSEYNLIAELLDGESLR